jgi:hypothetical protein
VSEEYDGGVTVSWEKPMDTGYGDGSAVVEYIVETSICPDFSETLACVYHSQVTGASSVELGRETLERGAETYYIRVTAQNEIGAGQEESVEQQFMMTVMELEVEQSGEDLQINWQYSVLDQPELKFVVSVTSSDGLMAEEMVYLVTEYTACKNDVTSGRSDSRKASKRRSSRSRVNGMVRSSSKEVRALESNGISDEATSICTEGFTGAHCQPCGTDMYSTECSEECDMMSTCHGHGRCSGSDGQCACYSGWGGDGCDKRLSCETGMYDVVVSIPLPEGPEAVLYSVTVTVENGDGDQGHPVEADAYVIGPPSSVAPLSVGEVSFSKWSYEWTHPIRFWQGEASHPVVYEIEVSCSGASMALVYDVTADLKNAATAVVTCSGSCSCSPSSGQRSGTITDGYGSYSNGESCRWLIASASTIRLSFSSFSTESGYDYVTINRCSSSSCSTVEQVARISGSVSSSNEYTSSTGYLQVLFTSDGSVTGSGFEATWSTETIGGELKAEWQEGYWSGAQEVTLTPDDTVMGVAGGLSELVCYQGDDVSFRVTPRNRLFDGPTSLVTVRALAPPTQVQGLVSEEYDGGVTVSWEEPMDTGYGDGSAVVEYIVETSICPDFSETPACVYHSQFLESRLRIKLVVVSIAKQGKAS